MTIAVLDSNILLSGIVGLQIRRSAPGAVLRAWRDGAFNMAASDHILDEVRRGLAKPYFRRRVSPAEADLAVRAIRSMAIMVEPTADVHASPDDADNLVIATAIAAGAQYLVTGDAELLGIDVEGLRLIGAAAFVERLDARI